MSCHQQSLKSSSRSLTDSSKSRTNSSKGPLAPPATSKPSSMVTLKERAGWHPVAEHDVMMDDGADDGVPQGGPAQQRLWQGGAQTVAHPAAHVSLRSRMGLSLQDATGCESGMAMETDLGVQNLYSQYIHTPLHSVA